MGYIRKWTLIGIIIGVISGFGAVIFYEMLRFSTKYFLEKGAGFIPPGEGAPLPEALNWVPPGNPYRLLLVITLGGILSGLIVYTFAPEAEGHGTDAAIRAFHRENGKIRARIPIVKAIASAITIGSGGSAGREGPTAQISAGLGSLIADALKLGPEDRRLMVAIGIGTGIGSIFKAPLGGALLAGEILYKRDIETEAIIPALIASPIGYLIFCSFEGYDPMFIMPHVYFRPIHLLFFLLLGVVEGVVGLAYIYSFYRTRDIFSEFFERTGLPQHVKPAFGAFLSGLLVLALIKWVNPLAGLGAVGTGYGFLQLAIYNAIPWKILLLIGIFKIVTTSLTIGSGGSGGVFAPGLVIGGMIGGATGILLHSAFPSVIPLSLVPAFVAIGMVSLFGGISKAPIANMVMVSEMTNNYHFLVPAMAAVFVSYLLTGDNTIYEEQVGSKTESPAHAHEILSLIMRSIKVREIMRSAEDVLTISPMDSLMEALQLSIKTHYRCLPVTENGRLVGLIHTEIAHDIPVEEWDRIPIRDVMIKDPPVVHPNDSLSTALLKITRSGICCIPVVEGEDMTLVGIITKDDIIRRLSSEVS